jgi:hypothetical protein
VWDLKASKYTEKSYYHSKSNKTKLTWIHLADGLSFSYHLPSFHVFQCTHPFYLIYYILCKDFKVVPLCFQNDKQIF